MCSGKNVDLFGIICMLCSARYLNEKHSSSFVLIFATGDPVILVSGTHGKMKLSRLREHMGSRKVSLMKGRTLFDQKFHCRGVQSQLFACFRNT